MTQRSADARGLVTNEKVAEVATLKETLMDDTDTFTGELADLSVARIEITVDHMATLPDGSTLLLPSGSVLRAAGQTAPTHGDTATGIFVPPVPTGKAQAPEMSVRSGVKAGGIFVPPVPTETDPKVG